MFSFLKKLFSGGNDQLVEMLANGAVIVDVRSKAEFQQGHAKGAQHIPLEAVKSQASKLKKAGKPIVTCCASGRRSGIAAAQLRAAGVEVVNGGPWQQVQRSLEKAGAARPN